MPALATSSARRPPQALRVLWIALALFMLVQGALAQAVGEGPGQRARLDAIRQDVQQTETTLGARELTDPELLRLRQRLDPVIEELRGLADELGGRSEQAKARLEQLGPKPAAGAPAETAELASDRAARERALAEADEAARIARATLVQAEQLTGSIADKRRNLFARQLFERGPSLISLSLWGALAASFPTDVRALDLLVQDWMALVAARGLDWPIAMVVAALLLAMALYYARARYLPRIMARLEADAEAPATRLRTLVSAVARLVAGALPAAIGSWLIYSAMQNAGLLPRRIEPFMWAVLGGVAFVAFVNALADATLAPRFPQRRVFGVADRNARILKQLFTSTATVLVAAKAVEALLQGIAAGLSLSIAARAAFALLFAGVVAYWLNKLRDVDQEAEDQCLGPYVPIDGAVLAPLRLIGWALVVAISGAALLGYVVLASFLADQAAWVIIVGSLLALAFLLADEGLQALLTGEGKVAMALQTNVGLRKRSLHQASVLISGAAKLAILVIGAMLLLAPWGIESADLTSSIRAAFFGFKVGDVTISLSSIIVAGVLFALGLAATRALQRWLDERFLPATDLDVGLRNSLKTVAGYVGFVAALALAISTLGLSLDRLTIVAGALSVGIGFGLQSVVSNFVSGLILLWERPIRVGDLIVVGDGEGVVKRINVRSTEIETFDRSTVIVPNSNLISGVVKNRVRSDRTGRVLVSLSVPRATNPQHVREVMERAARNHPTVMTEPPPRVFFKKIGDISLEFDLFCVVADVDTVGRVSSDLHFAIYSELIGEGIGAPEREIAVRGLDRIEETLDELVDTIEEGQEARRRGGTQAPAAPKPRVPARGKTT